MPSIHQALEQIDEIRAALSRSRLFRGYRSSSTALTGLIAVAAASVQTVWLDDPIAQLPQYLAVWFAAAVVSVVLVVGKSLLSLRDDPGVVQRELFLAALHKLAPCLAAGVLVTYVIAMFHASNVGLLPGLWMLLLGLGVFASRDNLPRSISIVGAYYILAGLMAMTLSPADAMQPWVMGGAFAVGQFLGAATLYLTLERRS